MSQANTNNAAHTAAQPGTQSGLAQHVMNDGRTVVFAPALGVGLTVACELPGARFYGPTIRSIDEAFAYAQRVKGPIKQPPDDDNGHVRENLTAYRYNIYNAMMSRPHDVDSSQMKQWDVYTATLQHGYFGFRDVEARSWVLADEIIKLHESEPHTKPAYYDKNLRSVQDERLTCSERMNTITTYLAYNKWICVHIIESHFALLRFAAAPHAVMTAKPGVKVGYQQTIHGAGARVANATHAPAAPHIPASHSGAPPGSAPLLTGHAHPEVAPKPSVQVPTNHAHGGTSIGASGSASGDASDGTTGGAPGKATGEATRETTGEATGGAVETKADGGTNGTDGKRKRSPSDVGRPETAADGAGEEAGNKDN